MKLNEKPIQAQCQNSGKKQNDKNKENRKGLPKISINVSQTQYAVVKSTAKKLKWTAVNEPIASLNFDICWTDSHVRQEFFYKMQQHQRINHFPGMEILSRKNFLGRSLMAFRNRFEEQYKFFPLTWMLPNQFADLKDYHDNRQSGKAQTFIVKPEASCQGRGIFLTRHIERLKGQRCVVQRYMHRPFLIDGLKFDLRIYVLVTGIDPLRIFVFEEGLGRFATEPYVAPKSDNLDNKFMHLTNYAINKNHPNFVFNESQEECDKGHKRSLSSVYKNIQEMGHDITELKNRINDIIIKTIITGYPTLSRMQQSVHPQNYSNDMCFQILGFDVMLDHKLNPYLIQINYTPSFTADTPFDKMVKKSLIYDTLKLVGVNQQWKHEMKKKRENQIKERMLTGKRKKLALQEKIEIIKYHTKQRNAFEQQNMGNFRKIFVKNDEQFFDYRKFYEYAEQLYLEHNRLTATSSNYNLLYIPFLKDTKPKSKKEKRERSIFQNSKDQQSSYRQQQRQSNEVRRVTSAKPQSKKKVLVSSTNFLLEDQKKDKNQQIKDIYFEDDIFKNGNLKKALTKKKNRSASKLQSSKE